MRFVAEHAIAGIPNVVVDGSPNADTVLTLSHWPGSPTPPSLRDDLSAQIAFHALAQPALFDGIEAVTNNHFDQDGTAAMFALLQPAEAHARREQLIDVARAGDFGTFATRDMARVAMTLAALDDDEMSPLPSTDLDQPYPLRCGALYGWALPRLMDMIDHPGRWRELWADEDDHLGASLDAIAAGKITITEYPDVDLAVVEVPDGWRTQATHRFTRGETAAVHPMAVNNSTSRLRVAVVHGGNYHLELRYESWVMLTSRAVLPRPDLRLLATELSDEDTVAWQADSPGALTPRLQSEAASSLSPTAFVDRVRQFLATARSAWDPFAPN